MNTVKAPHKKPTTSRNANPVVSLGLLLLASTVHAFTQPAPIITAARSSSSSSLLQQRTNTALFVRWPGQQNDNPNNKNNNGGLQLSSGDSNNGGVSVMDRLSQAAPSVETLEEMAAPVTDVLDDVTGGWALGYADLTPADETTPIGISFLLTNLAYGIAGSLLMTQGNAVLGLVTELACIASFCYHYSQLKFGQEGSNIVRLALLVDYFFALSAIIIGSVQLYLGHQLPMEVVVGGALSVASLGACWVRERGLPYIFFHSLWHLFSGYTGYLIGNTYMQQ